MLNSVLLIESESDVVRDVTASLQLVDIPVVAKGNVADGLAALSDSRPALIIVRMDVGNQQGAATDFVSKAKDLVQGTPIVVMCTPSEKSQLGTDERLFAGTLLLPVEFPTTTKQVQSFMTGGSVQPAEEATGANDGELEAASEQGEGSPGWLPWHHKNLMIVYAIHDAVLEELKLVGKFPQLDEDKVPDLVSTVTNKVTAEFRRKAQRPAKPVE